MEIIKVVSENEKRDIVKAGNAVDAFKNDPELDKNDDGVYNEGDVVIKTYGAMDEAGSKLMNDVVNSIELEGNAALQPHWDEVRGKIEASGAKFIIEAYDKYNEKGTAVAKITTRELFALD